MKKTNKYIYLFIGISIFLSLLYLFYYSDGSYVLGAEGSYYIDAILLAKNYGYFWYNASVGYFATSYNFVFHLILIQWLFHSERLVNFVTIASLYVLPFAAMYLLCIEFKLKPRLALLLSIFYLTNPFTSYFLLSINQWNMIASYILPAFFLIIFKFYNKPKLLFVIFGIHSLLFAFGNANPPTMAIYQVAIILFVMIISLYRNKTLVVRDIFYHYLLILSSFVLFNFWWIINWIAVLADANAIYSTTFALGWLKNVGDSVPTLWRSFSLSGLLPYPHFPKQDFLTAYYGNSFSEIIFLVPIFIVALTLLKKESMNLLTKVLGLSLIILGLIAKGVNPPFGILYELAIRYIPLFKIFKTAPEKWGVLFVFVLTLYLIFNFKKYTQSSIRKFAIVGLTIYTIYTSVPFLTGNFLPDYFYSGYLHISKHFRYKQEYLDLKATLNQDPIQYRVLSLPGHLNYQVALRISGDKFYGGGDPVLTNTNKPFIAQYNNAFAPDFDVLFDNISNPNYRKLLGIYNIKKIVINKDMFPWFGFREKESLDEKEKIFDRQFSSTKNNVIDLYDVGQSFVPRFYIADQIIKSDLSRNKLPKIIAENNASTRSAIFVPTTRPVKQYLPNPTPQKDNLPRLTFQKVNPTKYRLRFEGVSGPFLLVFSENYHKDWQLYTSQKEPINHGSAKIVGNYFSGAIKELEAESSYFDKEPFLTWNLKPIADNKHGLVNGYANSWFVESADMGNKTDFELILEYKSQRLYYIGVIGSIIVLITSATILMFSLRHKR